jgi:membrane-bound metal-dependent hydrolase YbcI (DUF457 family)
MLLWFIGGSWVLVWAVLQDPAVDYRLVMVGSLLPDLVYVSLAQTLLFAVAILAGVMLATIGRRRLRRSLLGIPFGVFIHLVLDGVWTQSHTFWWPFLGGSLHGGLPSLQHPVAVIVAEELVGAGAIVWCVRRFRLTEPSRRAIFLHTGRVGRDLTQPG